MRSEIENIVKGSISANRQSQRKLYEYFYGFCFNTCMAFCKNNEEAMEMMNNGFLKVFRQLPRFKAPHPHFEVALKTWIKQIMIHTAIDRYQETTKKYFLAEAAGFVFEEPGMEQSVIDKLPDNEMLNLVQQLSPPCRIVYSLYVIHQFSHEKIADALNITMDASQTRLDNARRHIKKMLEHPWVPGKCA